MERSSSGSEASVQCVFTWKNRVVVIQGQRSPTRAWYNWIIIGNCDAQLTWKILNWFWFFFKSIFICSTIVLIIIITGLIILILLLRITGGNVLIIGCVQLLRLSRENVVDRCYPYFLPKLCSPLAKDKERLELTITPLLRKTHLPRNHGCT